MDDIPAGLDYEALMQVMRRRSVRAFAMYRGSERMEEWEDCEEKPGPCKDAFTTAVPNPSGKLEA